MSNAGQDASESSRKAEVYYDSADADRFYFEIWGGEDIHVGLYESEDQPIRDASRRTVDHMLGVLGPLRSSDRVLDMGAGYGGAARVLADQAGARISCLNLSETQNARNRQLCARGGYAGIEVVHGNFEHLPFEDGTFHAVWCQDAILHSGRRQRVIEEVARVLRPGGRFVFTDPMQKADAPREALQPIYDRIHLDSLASFDFYREAAASAGLEVVSMEDLTPQLTTHYGRVRAELESRRDALVSSISADYIDRMLTGLGHWVRAGEAGQLAWGVMLLRKPDA